MYDMHAFLFLFFISCFMLEACYIISIQFYLHPALD